MYQIYTNMGENIKITDETRAILEGYLAKQHARRAKRLAAQGKKDPFDNLDKKRGTGPATEEQSENGNSDEWNLTALSATLTNLIKKVRQKQEESKDDLMVNQRLESVARYMETARGLLQSLMDE